MPLITFLSLMNPNGFAFGFGVGGRADSFALSRADRNARRVRSLTKYRRERTRDEEGRQIIDRRRIFIVQSTKEPV